MPAFDRPMHVFITGTAGFIGFHLARRLLEEGHVVHGFDGLTDYYDVRLKQRRHALLREYPAFAANEAMSYAWVHLHGVPTTKFRFFTVYGPWGRPDMALFKFTRGILEGTPIEIYNHGDMWRDFTYVDDLVHAIRRLIEAVPPAPDARSPEAGWQPVEGDTLSPAAPWRVVNIGNSDKVRLLDFVEAIEAEVGRPAQRRYLPMQAGDVPATWADCTLLKRLTGCAPRTPIREGVARFVRWYLGYRKEIGFI